MIEMNALNQHQDEIKRQHKRKNITDEATNEELDNLIPSGFRFNTFLNKIDRLRS